MATREQKKWPLFAVRSMKLMLVALNPTSTRYQIRKASASISDGGVYMIEAMNAVGSDSINFTVTVHFLRLLDCNLCSASKGSTVNCIFSSSPNPTEVKFNNLSLIPMKEASESDNYTVSIMIPDKSVYTLAIRNEYNVSVVDECNRSATTAPTSFTALQSSLTTVVEKKLAGTNEVTVQSRSNAAEISCGRNEGYIAAIAVLSALVSAALIGMAVLLIYVKRWTSANKKEDTLSAKENDVEMHASSIYQDASKLTKATETYEKVKGSATMPEYASISETK